LEGVGHIWEAVCKEFGIPEFEQVDFNRYCVSNKVCFSDFGLLRQAAENWKIIDEDSRLKVCSLKEQVGRVKGVGRISLPKGLFVRYPILRNVLFDKVVYVRDEKNNPIGAAVVIRAGIGKVVGWSLCHKSAGDVWDAKKGIFQAVMRIQAGKDCKVRSVYYVLRILKDKLDSLLQKSFRKEITQHTDRYRNFHFLYLAIEKLKVQIESKEREEK